MTALSLSVAFPQHLSYINLTPLPFPLSQPDLSDGDDEAIDQDIVGLEKLLHQQVTVLRFHFL